MLLTSSAAGNVVKTGEQAAGAVIHTARSCSIEPVNRQFARQRPVLLWRKTGQGRPLRRRRELVKGVGDIASSAAGTAAGAESAAAGGLRPRPARRSGADTAKWRAESPARSAALFAEAEKKLAGQAFPPVKP
ncbi:MAG: hypothetical protein U1F77_17385 [Kiritimatiellia bacterium]